MIDYIRKNPDDIYLQCNNNYTRYYCSLNIKSILQLFVNYSNGIFICTDISLSGDFRNKTAEINKLYRNLFIIYLKSVDKLYDIKMNIKLLINNNFTLLYEYYTLPGYEILYISLFQILRKKILNNEPIIRHLLYNKWFFYKLCSKLSSNLMKNFVIENLKYLSFDEIYFILNDICRIKTRKQIYNILSKNNYKYINNLHKKKIYNNLIKPLNKKVKLSTQTKLNTDVKSLRYLINDFKK